MTPVDAYDLDAYTDGDTEVLIAAALAFLEGETLRHFGAPKEHVEIRTGSGSRRLWLREPPAADPAPTVEQRSAGGDWEDVDASGTWEVRGRSLVRLDARHWSESREYRITYTHGYETLPADVEMAVSEIVRWAKAELKLNPLLQSENLGDYSYTLIGPLTRSGEKPFPASVQATINRWRDQT